MVTLSDTGVPQEVENAPKEKKYFSWTDNRKALALATADRFGQDGRQAAVHFLQLNFPTLSRSLIFHAGWKRTNARKGKEDKLVPRQ